MSSETEIYLYDLCLHKQLWHHLNLRSWRNICYRPYAKYRVDSQVKMLAYLMETIVFSTAVGCFLKLVYYSNIHYCFSLYGHQRNSKSPSNKMNSSVNAPPQTKSASYSVWNFGSGQGSLLTRDVRTHMLCFYQHHVTIMQIRQPWWVRVE